MPSRGLRSVLVLGALVAATPSPAARLEARLVTHAPAGSRPTTATLLDAGARLAVADRAGRTVSMFETATMRVERTFEGVGFGPWGIESAGDVLVVSDWSGDSLALLDRATGASVGTVKVGLKPSYVAVAPGGKRAFAAGNLSGDLSIADVERRATVRTLAVGFKPMGVAVSPDGRWLWVASCKSRKLSKVDLVHEVVLENHGAPLAATTNLVVTPDGRHLLAAGEDSRLLVVSTETGAFTKIRVSADPSSVAVAPDGLTAFVTSYRGNVVDLVDLAAGETYDSIPVGLGPMHVVTDGSRLFTVNEQAGSVSVHALAEVAPLPLPEAKPASLPARQGDAAPGADAAAVTRATPARR